MYEKFKPESICLKFSKGKTWYHPWLIGIIFLIFNSLPLISQNTFLVSGGVSGKWIFDKSVSGEGHEDNVNSSGKTGYFVSVAINWADDMDLNFNSYMRFTVEKFDGQLSNWEWTPIGSFNSTILRIEPFYIRSRIGESKFIYSFNPVGMSVSTGKTSLLPNSYCYDQGSRYLIKGLHFDKSIGWSLVGVGVDLELTRNLTIGFETVLLEGDGVNITFQTEIGDVHANSFSANSFLPGKIILTIKI
jgi:hypothetical protein